MNNNYQILNEENGERLRNVIRHSTISDLRSYEKPMVELLRGYLHTNRLIKQESEMLNRFREEIDNAQRKLASLSIESEEYRRVIEKGFDSFAIESFIQRIEYEWQTIEEKTEKII